MLCSGPESRELCKTVKLEDGFKSQRQNTVYIHSFPVTRSNKSELTVVNVIHHVLPDSVLEVAEMFGHVDQ